MPSPAILRLGSAVAGPMPRRQFDIIRQRQRAQRLVGRPFVRPEEAVASLVAVQSQDYAGAKWGIAQRTAGATEAALDACFDAGALLRTHVLRPTWHLVCPEDIRWLLDLTAPRVRRLLASSDRKLGLDGRVRARSQALLGRALRDGQYRTRAELAAALEAGNLACRGQRLAHLLAHAELDAVVCSGPRRGKQLTYALLDERAPVARSRTRDEALVELVRRYFSGHGPATVHDCAWWSGLRVVDVKTGIVGAGRALEQATIEGRRYWFASRHVGSRVRQPTVHLLPNYDEYLIAFRDRGAVFDLSILPERDPLLISANVVTVDGQVAGVWRRRIGKGEVIIETKLARRMERRGRLGLGDAVSRYGRFLGAPVRLA